MTSKAYSSKFAIKFGISSIPTVLLFENGEVVKTSVGYVSKEKLISLFGI